MPPIAVSPPYRLDIDEETSSGESSLRTTANASSADSPPALQKHSFISELAPRIDVELAEFFSENVAAKIWRVAESHLKDDNSLEYYPEFIPTTGETAGKYTSKPATFWTCGFFPGSLYALLERAVKYPKYFPSPKSKDFAFQSQLLQLCRTWSEPLHGMATRTNTHDLGFIIQPALRMDWEVTGNTRSLQSIITAANSLASRYDERVCAIRSWDRAVSKRYNFTDRKANFVVIIDSMCNMDLLFYAGYHTSNHKLIDIATKHAHTVRQSIIRDDSSTFHFVNFDPQTRAIKNQMTHQGYQDWSTWSRGQAWGILGFTQTYIWTKDPVFLATAIALADYFLSRLSASPHAYPYVPLWDFDAPTPPNTPPLRDSSAGMIAANGLLLLHQILHNNSPYLAAALRIAKETTGMALAPDRAAFTVDDDGALSVAPGAWDGILMHATANDNEFATVRYKDHGLVYADYYFLELGNKLLRMGLV